jgi:Tol biopolymer transport system component
MLTPEYTLAPDGRTVYFQARGNAVWWLPLNENDESAAEPRPTGLPAIGAQVAQLAISLDGRRMAWTALASSNHVWATYVRGTSKIAGPLTEGDGIRYGLPQPSSDGRVALVGAPAGTHTSIFLLAPGPALRQLTTDPPNHGGPQWTPGEREIAFVTDHGKGPGYWAVDPETGRERPLFLLAELPRPPGKSQASSAAPSTNIAFSRDFTRLVMAIVQNGTPNLWVASLRGMRPDGRLVQRTFESEGGSYPAWSSDGQWISYQCNEGTDTHVCVVDAEHGERLQLTHVPNGQSWVGGWAPDNDRIVFAARRGAVWNVAAVSRTTQAVQTLTGFTSPRGYVRYPRWDPANDRVVFERSETTGRIWSVALP